MPKSSRGGRRGSGGGSATTPQAPAFQDFQEAFQPGKDYQAVNGVNHVNRTVSRTTQQEWDQYANQMNNGVTSQDEQNIMRQWTPTPNAKGAYVTGYVRTQNSFAINEAFYDPNNQGKSLTKMFKRKADRDTVKSLDKAIENNQTQNDGNYIRFCGDNSIQSTFGLTNQQMTAIKNAPNMTSSELAALNQSLIGSKSYNPAYTSTSANRSLNAFSDPNAKQSKGYYFERHINTPKGTKAYAPRQNAQESETIFGRNLTTSLQGISISSDGHIVIHEKFEGYR